MPVFCDNEQIAARLDDRDLSGAGYRSQGPFVELRFKFDEETLRQVWLLRRMAAMVGDQGTDATERVLERVSKTKNNQEFLSTLKSEVI